MPETMINIGAATTTALAQKPELPISIKVEAVVPWQYRPERGNQQEQSVLRVLNSRRASGLAFADEPHTQCGAGGRVTVHCGSQTSALSSMTPFVASITASCYRLKVSFTKDNNGTITELRVGPPDAYLPEPENDSKKSGKKRKVKEDPF